MPASKRTTRRPRIGAELTLGIRMLLERNWVFQYRLERRSMFGQLTEDEIDWLWRLHGPQIIREWVEAKPGSRPYHWWRFEAPERRRCVNGLHWFDDPQWQAATAEVHAEYPDIFGVPGGYHALSYGVPVLSSRELASEAAGDAFETEAAFLDRLGLWAPGERERWERLSVDADGDSE